MRMLLVGANGQLGTDLRLAFRKSGAEVVPVVHADLEIRNRDAVTARLAAVRPDVVVNTAAFHNVDACEKDPTTAFAVNAIGVSNLAAACAQSGAVLVHYSTDYVFGGGRKEPYGESDAPAPVNAYGASKVAGEHLISYLCPQSFVIRTCGLYGTAGSSGKGGNFVETMLRKARAGETIRVVDDQVLTPTSTADLASLTVSLVQSREFGLYHVSCEGECSWYEFACAIFSLEELTVSLFPVSTTQFSTGVRRPDYSVLSKEKLDSVGLRMPDWHDSLSRYLAARMAVARDGLR